jgi:hypothetical protein
MKKQKSRGMKRVEGGVLKKGPVDENEQKDEEMGKRLSIKKWSIFQEYPC